MSIFIGTSGYSYPEWKGTFYPEKLPAKQMLPFYAEQFSTVESNYTFQKMPTQGLLCKWADQVPANFRFALKAPQQITHRKRLKETEELADELFREASALKDRLGPVLFQLPPNFKKDTPRLKLFLKSLPQKFRVAFEFRHPSWFDEETYDCLRARSVALCCADTAEQPLTKIVSTADWGYLRLRGVDYTEADLRKWHAQIQSQGWETAFVYFKHEETASGPKLAKQLVELTGR